MIVNDVKISLKMKEKGQLSIKKDIKKQKKNASLKLVLCPA